MEGRFDFQRRTRSMQLLLNLKPMRVIAVLVLVNATVRSHGALLAYEPFTNAPGTAIIGSSDGFGFNGAWQINSSVGVATNTGYALSYTDGASNTLVTAGGAGFFQGGTAGTTGNT